MDGACVAKGIWRIGEAFGSSHVMGDPSRQIATTLLVGDTLEQVTCA
jgi:hypothetical protein